MSARLGFASSARLACTAIYDPIAPDSFDKVYRVGETVCGTVTISGIFYIVMQGTENVAGWIADAEVEHVTPYPVLGKLHSGFYKNLPALFAMLTPDIPERAAIVVTGHSKGAGEAVQLAALLRIAGFIIIQCVLFACPNAGDSTFATWLADNIPGTSFRNAPKILQFLGDPVPLVPIEPNVPPYPHQFIHQPPQGFRYFTGIEWHRGEHYRKAFA